MDGCIEWQGSRTREGYGMRRYMGRHHTAHRVAYMQAKGEIPVGYQVDHLCNNPPCINPDHLEAVTGSENIRRAVARRTHCRKGHPLDEANTYWRDDRNGQRRCCRACNRQAVAAYKRRKDGVA